jgi:hypothetical protein
MADEQAALPLTRQSTIATMPTALTSREGGAYK